MMGAPEAIEVSSSTHLLTSIATSKPELWKKLGNIETKIVSSELSNVAITAPIYVSGLARSGSTILLEILAEHPDTCAHTYGDFPFLFTPMWWNMVMRLHPRKVTPLRERAHGDGIHISQSSPEAMEEVLWMAYFSHLHRIQRSEILDASLHMPEFEHFYRDHIKKILYLRKGTRYLAKANYNITRIAYLLRLFPDARFVIPIRHPVAHVESLIRQHQRFTKAAEQNPRVISQMKAGGHFEFGPHRTPIHTGDDTRLQHVLDAWSNGDDATGYALQWSMLYDYVYTLSQDPSVAQSIMIVPFEKCCKHPKDILAAIFEHCRLYINEHDLNEKAARIRAPEYRSGLTSDQVQNIQRICSETASHYGY